MTVSEETKNIAAFTSGLIFAWISRLQGEENDALKQDMQNEANRLADLAGVKLWK